MQKSFIGICCLLFFVASVFSYDCKSCYGDMCCNIPSNHEYYLTDFCGSSGETACGYPCSAMKYFTADRQRFGCNSYLNICARGKCLKAKVIDAGPADWVERDAGMPIIDSSVPTCQYFTGHSSCGWADRFLITAVPTSVKDDSELGPYNVTEEEYNAIVSDNQRLYDAEMRKLEELAPKVAPCCSPDQWEGYQFSFDEKHHWRAGMNISYDFTNKRFRVLIEERQGGKSRKILETIAFFANKTEYTIDHTSNTCRSGTLDEPMTQDCVAKDAVLEASPVIGGSLKTNIWRFSRVERQQTVDYIEIRTVDQCIPVDIFVADHRLGVDSNYFWDVTPGIKDPSVFNVPSTCKNETVIAHPQLQRLMDAARSIAIGRMWQL